MRALVRIALILLFVALVLAALGLWFASRYVDVELQDGRAIATLTLSEADLDRVVRYSVGGGGPHQAVLEDLTRSTIGDGVIRVEGAYTAADGSRRLGWVDLALRAEGGRLVAQIQDLDRDGIPKGGPAHQALNAALAEQMASQRGPERGTRIVSVVVGDGAVKVRAEATLRDRGEGAAPELDAAPPP